MASWLAILMDIRLSGADGLALTQALKSDPATSDIVIVVFKPTR
jgi:CheY-like chemotaxis protein